MLNPAKIKGIRKLFQIRYVNTILYFGFSGIFIL